MTSTPSLEPISSPRSDSERAPRRQADEWIERIISTYGELLYDLCQSMLWSPADAPDAYRSILRILNRKRKSDRFKKHERAWILQIAFEELRGMKRRSPRLLTPAEQVMLDSNPDPKARIRFLDSYFHRLPIESQLLLLLKDKHSIPLTEAASVLQIPEASAQLQRLLALRLLESWVYSAGPRTKDEESSSSFGGMTCFDARNKLLDAIDGSLSHEEQTNFTVHMRECQPCRLKQERTVDLLRTLQGQPKNPVPEELQNDPLAFPIRRLKRIFSNPRAVWKQLPAGVRLMIEGGSIAAVVILGIKLGPLVREMYEKRMEMRLQTMIAAEDAQSLPLARGQSNAEDAEIMDETTNPDPEHENPTGIEVQDEILVGQGEIWRFNLKTDAPALVRTKILKTLKDAGINEDTPGIAGVEAPGGIQFDLLVPRTAIPVLKTQLEKLASEPNENLPFSETFTWYKNRSKKPIPRGTSRMVIWLSQI